MEAYQRTFFLNSGFGGSVHAAEINGTNENVAIKTVKKNSSNEAAIAREISCVQTFKHPGIITTLEVIEMEEYVCFVQELADGGDLFDHLQRFGCVGDEAALKSLFGQIVSSVAYMHELGYCHRDIKPENVVLKTVGDELVCKLIDFGLSEKHAYVQGRVGTDAYAAPEIASITSGTKVNGFAADTWSMGIMLVTLLCGRIPWAVASPNEDADFASFLERHEAGIPAAVFNATIETLGLTPSFATLLDSMLNPDPLVRPTLEEVLDFLDEPWLVMTSKMDDDYMYKVSNQCDSGYESGCSWGDLTSDDEVDFSALPLPSFEPLVGGKPVKNDSGVSFS